MMGFKEDTAYTAEEARKIMIKALTDPQGKFSGLALKLTKTWTGTMSMLRDKWFLFRAYIMSEDIDIWEPIKTSIMKFNNALSVIWKDMFEFIKINKQAIEEGMRLIK